MTALADFLLARIADDEEFALRYPPTAAARPRALAECEAKRRIVEAHPAEHAGTPFEAYSCRTCVNPEERDGYPDEWTAARWPCPTLRALALPYADHPDYDPEWKP